MAGTLNWGILGTGNIARQFAAGAMSAPRSRLIAVGSRSADSASAYAAAHRISTAYESYAQVLADRDVQAVYISLPNHLHHEWTLRALRAGKHVLCEKPIAANAAEAEEMFDAAEKAGLRLVEAFMYRTHPLTAAWLGEAWGGAIGQVRLVRSSFCYRTTRIAGNIRFEPAMAGGALMDIGCYCIDLALLVAREAPSLVQVAGRRHETGVDDMAAGLLGFPGGMISSFTCGMSLQADNTAYICGTEGYIEVPVPWKPPVKGAAYTIARSTPPRMDNPASTAPPPPSRVTRHVDAPLELYGLEADAFVATVLDGTVPLVITPRESLANMRILDQMRRGIA